MATCETRWQCQQWYPGRANRSSTPNMMSLMVSAAGQQRQRRSHQRRLSVGWQEATILGHAAKCRLLLYFQQLTSWEAWRGLTLIRNYKHLKNESYYLCLLLNPVIYQKHFSFEGMCQSTCELLYRGRRLLLCQPCGLARNIWLVTI